MMEKFKNILTDDEFTILHREESKFAGYDVVTEHWLLDGIAGNSIIFCKRDVAKLSDEDIINLIKTKINIEKIIISRTSPEYVFCNYGWIAVH